MKRFLFTGFLLAATVLFQSTATIAADLESFEFNDPANTLLAGAANTANPGNTWFEDGGTSPSAMLPSDVRNGAYNIVKGSLVLESNYLDISNISNGTYYLTARMSNWRFGDTAVAAEPEEFRLAFLNDDDPPGFGATITAQMQIRRNAAGNVEISGDAILTGPDSNLTPVQVSAVQTQPFTAVLELNKTSNTYKVYYKDGSNPTQVLGMGNVDPDRGGNAVRMSANNDFSEFSTDYPFDVYEVFAIDRIALSNTNPLTDLITLEISRADGSVTLRNTSGAALTGLQSYSITSTTGAFDPTKWKTVTGNYDSTGNGTVDNAPWAVTTSSKTQLAEAFQSGDGGGLTINQNVVLNLPGGGTWLKSPFEDVHMSLNFAGGVTRTVNVNFTGNLGEKWAEGDFNFDRDIDADDWLLFIEDAETNLSGLSRVERYQRGDLNGDGFNNIVDFGLFKSLYDDANGGAGAFESMLAGLTVPEPGSAALLASVAMALAAFGRRRRNSAGSAPDISNGETSFVNSSIGDRIMPRAFSCVRIFCLVVTLATTSSAAVGGILEEFTFDDPNSTPLENADNTAIPGNVWLEETANRGISEVQNGNFHVVKQNDVTYRNILDIENVESGKIWYVAEISGWSFSSIVGVNEFDSTQLEEINFTFLDLQEPEAIATNSSRVTGQASIARQSDGTIELRGTALGTGTNISQNLELSLMRATPFHIALEVNKTANQYTVYYKDGANDYLALGQGTVDPARNADAIRFYVNNSMGGTGEFLDIDRLYITDVSPLDAPVEPVSLTLRVLSNGDVSIANDTDTAISFNSYRILSPTDDLDIIGWDSLSDQNIDLVDGPDLDSAPGNSPGESWDEAGGSDNGVLAESFLSGLSTIAPNDSLSLGSAFQMGGAHESLTFQYRDMLTGSVVTGEIDLEVVAGLDGDFNQDGTVDAADYVMWRKTNVGSYADWVRDFGETLPGGGGNSLNNTNVPEPRTVWLVAIFLSGIVFESKRNGLLRPDK
jgi:hypothetical protein